MKRGLLPALLLLVPALSPGQGTSNALLWTISGNGLERPSHLYGTVHSTDERAYTFSRAVEGTMDQVATVAGELDLDAVRKSAVAMMAAMTIPDGGKLEDLYSKKDWKRVDAAMKEHLGPMAGLFMRMKPFFVMASLTEGSMRKERPKYLDDHLLAEAKDREKRVIGLETMEEQLNAIDALPLKEQAAMLLEHLKRGGDTQDLEAMMEAYAAQDLAGLMAVSRRHPLPKVLERALFTDRNLRMAHRMDSVMRADGSALFLVGAAHLPGEGGVIELLRERGYAVEPGDVVGFESFPPGRFLNKGIQFTNDSLDFGVDLPARPRMLEWDSDTAKGVFRFVVGSMRDDVGVTVWVFSTGDPSADDSDDPLLIGGAEFKGELDQRPVSIQGYDGRRIIKRQEEQDMAVQIVRRDRRLYVLRVTAPHVDEMGLLEGILDSFRFTDLPE